MGFQAGRAVSRACIAAVVCGMFAGAAARAALIGPDFKIGPDVARLDSLTVTAGNADGVALTTQYYLAAWRDVSGGEAAARICGALVSNTGVVSVPFFISDAGGLPQKGPVQRVRAAFDGTHFLVIWADTRPGGSGVRGAFVSLAGAVVGGADFLIAPTARTTGVNPQLVFTGTGGLLPNGDRPPNENYFVAWQDDPLSGDGTQIYFTRVSIANPDLASVVIQPVKVVDAVAGHDPSQQFEFLVKGPKAPKGEALIVYQDTGATPHATYAVRVMPNSTINGPACGTRMFTRDFSATGAGAPIGGACVNDEYVLLASKDVQIDCTVSRAWLRSDGSVALSTSAFTLAGQGKTGLEEDHFPLAVYNDREGSGLEEFLFLRNSKVTDVAYHIFMKRVQLDGTDRDPNMAVVDGADTGGLNGAVAAALPIKDPAQTGLTVSQYLVVWMDGRRRAADPPFQTNIYGALIDNRQAGNEARPYLRPCPLPSPLIGNEPLTVGFNGGFSTGVFDGVQWDFGDPNANDTNADKLDDSGTNAASALHKYTAEGTYLAVFSLKRAGLNYNTFVMIYAGSHDPGGFNGPPQTVGGVQVDSSAGINADVAFDSLYITRNFVKANTDAFRINGIFNVSKLPVNPTDMTFTFTLGTKSYPAKLLSNGTFVSEAGKTPIVQCAVNTGNGLFAMVGTLDDLSTALAGTGVVNATVSKQTVNIPVAVSFAGMSSTQTLQAQYTATQGKVGKVTFLLGSTGAPSEGLFHVVSGLAVEKLTQGKTGDKIHDLSMLGNLTLPGSAALVKPASGYWRITFGNFRQSIPVEMVTQKGNVFTYKGKKIAGTLTDFQYNVKSGAFYMALKSIPAEGIDASGMALSNVLVTRADMAVTLDLDKNGGGAVKGSGFVRLRRKDVGKTRWTTR